MSFKYNSSGLRTKKVVGDKTIEYYYAGDLLVAQFDGTTWVRFIYAPNGEVIGFTHGMVDENNNILDGDYCYYVKNAQGDVLGFYSMFIKIYREYTYDAWGNVTGVYDENGNPVTNPDDPAFLNPLRYRGYYYDNETGLYYLNSRYYNPEWGRFVSADGVVSGTGEDINGYNVYSYCFNDPVNLNDSSGCWPQWMKNAANWVNNNIIQPVANFFSPSTNTISGQFQEGIFRGSGSLTGGYSEFNWRLDDKIKSSGSQDGWVGGFGKASVGNANGKIGIGNGNLSASLKGVADGLVATAQAGLHYKDGFGVGAKAKVCVLSGRATTEFNIFGWQVELGVSGELLSIGAEATIGIFPTDDGGKKFDIAYGVSPGLFGWGFVARVKVPG